MRCFWPALLLAAAVAVASGPRSESSIDAGWRFHEEDVSGAAATGFDDSSWQAVSLPHTWNVDDGADGGTYYRGIGWYRRKLEVGPELAGKRLYLRFGAASLKADVYVNGQEAGRHEGGFGAFCFDVTSLVHSGSNVIAVEVDNSNDPDIAPLSGDFTIYGGLYRDAWLVALNPVSISPLDDGSCGVYLTPSVSNGKALVNVRAELRNATSQAERAEVTCRVLDGKGRQVGSSTFSARLEADSTARASGNVGFAHPHLWDGVRDPYLYRAQIEVRVHGKLVDELDQPLGVRTYRVDPVLGLVLNGKPYDLHGVDLHQGRPSCGWAATRAMQDQDYAMVHELGCTGVRMPHYEHAPHEYALCDRYGICVWAELCLVNRMTDSDAFRKVTEQQLRELVKQNYNHPSILFWSMYNEPGYDRKKGPDEWKFVEELVRLAHRLDPSRPTTGAVSMGANQPLDWYMDVTAFNRYWGWYYGPPSDWPSGLDKLRQQAGGRTFGMSEYGAGASVHQHENDPKQPKAASKWHPEEWQSIVHEHAYAALKARPWIWCKFIWVMFDFASDSRNEGDHAGINDKGLVTGDRMVRKDAFYFYKANWTVKPFVYVTDRRFDPRPAGQSVLKVYSNCPSVELFLNGHSLGAETNLSHVFSWSVSLPAGKCSVKALGHEGKRTVRDAVVWEAGGSVGPSHSTS